VREMAGDLWDCAGWKVIPTNCGGVMGRGLALQAKQRFPDLQNRYQIALENGYPPTFREVAPMLTVEGLILLPVKRDWRDAADLHLIEVSCRRLRSLSLGLLGAVYLPLLGCGFGELYEADVLPILHRELRDDQFVLVRPGPVVAERYPDSLRPGVRKDRTFARKEDELWTR
jgi:hypothetical protein